MWRSSGISAKTLIFSCMDNLCVAPVVLLLLPAGCRSILLIKPGFVNDEKISDCYLGKFLSNEKKVLSGVLVFISLYSLLTFSFSKAWNWLNPEKSLNLLILCEKLWKECEKLWKTFWILWKTLRKSVENCLGALCKNKKTIWDKTGWIIDLCTLNLLREWALPLTLPCLNLCIAVLCCWHIPHSKKPQGC